ncbi:MAG: hypothetical protein ACSHUF_00535 [Candidatus Nasuia deltocephalinicola]
MYFFMILVKFNLFNPITKIFFEIYKFNVFLFIFFILFLFFFILFFIIFIFYNFFLKNNKYYFLKSFFLEFFWIFFFFNFVSFLFFYSILLVFKLKKCYNAYLNIKIVSYQWKWYFIYLSNFGINFNFFSIFNNCIFKLLNFNNYGFYNIFYNVDNKLIIPINKIVRFIFFSNDVIHSLYIPSIGLKQDSIPGFLKDFYFKSNNFGNYYGFCTELCGKNHSYMPFILKILSIYSYNKWKTSHILKKIIILNY